VGAPYHCGYYGRLPITSLVVHPPSRTLVPGRLAAAQKSDDRDRGRRRRRLRRELRRLGEGVCVSIIIFAQLGLVFFHLGFEIAESFLAAGTDGGRCAGGVQRSGWQR